MPYIRRQQKSQTFSSHRSLFQIKAVQYVLTSCLLAFGSPSDSKAHVSSACISLVKKAPKSFSEAQARQCPIAAQVAMWLQLREGSFTGSFDQAVRLINLRAWPDKENLLQRAESLITNETPDARILAWFKQNPPRSGAGALYYLEALQRHGSSKQVTALAKKYWVDLNFQEEDESVFLEVFSKHLTTHEHWQRAQRLLWDERVDSALRLIPKLTSAQQMLVHARATLIRDLPGVEGAIARVPASHRDDEGLWYNRTKWRRQRQLETAPEYLLSHPKLVSAKPNIWVKERVVLARHLLQDGRPQDAYKLVANHHTSEGVDYADAEWLAGWISLRYLNKPQQALHHFEHLFKHVVTPLSKGRAGYWAARAADALHKPSLVQHWLQKAAAYPGHFYGQLALTALHPQKLPSLVHPVSSQAFSGKGLFHTQHHAEVLQLLAESDNEPLFKSYLENLAQELHHPEDEIALIKFVDKNYPRFVVMTSKRIARRKNFLLPEAYPKPHYHTKAEADGIDPALVCSIIRQESGFDPHATSPAGARGLMQLMMGTAKDMAKKLGIKISATDLHARPELNVKIGRHYLKLLMNAHGDSLALALAAYNAGPGNVRQWIEKYGNPRDPKIDAIDWIEQIPFPETRMYVHRVMENYMIYTQLFAKPTQEILPNPHVHPAHKSALKPTRRSLVPPKKTSTKIPQKTKPAQKIKSKSLRSK